MAGHSHWAGIKHKKARVDAVRGRLFSKLSKRITVAAKSGGDPAFNLDLKYAIDEAKAANMPKDNIDRAVKKGTGELPGVTYESFAYEGYGPGGSGFILDILTDNRNRTAAEIRKLFSNKGGNLAKEGAVSWSFEKKGLFLVTKSAAPEDRVMEVALEAGAEDMQVDDNGYQVVCDPSQFDAVKTALTEHKIRYESASVDLLAQNLVQLDPDTLHKAVRLYEELEEHEDVNNVYVNFEFPEEA